MALALATQAGWTMPVPGDVQDGDVVFVGFAAQANVAPTLPSGQGYALLDTVDTTGSTIWLRCYAAVLQAADAGTNHTWVWTRRRDRGPGPRAAGGGHGPGTGRSRPAGGRLRQRHHGDRPGHHRDHRGGLGAVVVRHAGRRDEDLPQPQRREHRHPGVRERGRRPGAGPGGVPRRRGGERHDHDRLGAPTASWARRWWRSPPPGAGAGARWSSGGTAAPGRRPARSAGTAGPGCRPR